MLDPCSWIVLPASIIMMLITACQPACAAGMYHSVSGLVLNVSWIILPASIIMMFEEVSIHVLPECFTV